MACSTRRTSRANASARCRIRESLIRTLTEKPTATAAEFVDKVLWEMRQFVGLSSARSDDKTVLAVRVK